MLFINYIKQPKPIRINKFIQGYKTSNRNKKSEIDFIENQISAVNENVSEILDLHKRIEKIGVKTGKSKATIENDFFSIRKDSINESLVKIGLDEVKSINELNNFMYKLLEKEIVKSSMGYVARSEIESGLPEEGKILNYHDAMDWLDRKIKDKSNSKIEVVNIESTLTIPFKIGDMASSVSLIGIATIASYAMPVFMVIWLGSLFVTRRIEIMNLHKTKDISMVYPHIFNLFVVETTKSQDLNLYLLGVEKAKGQLNSSISLIKLIKGFVFLSLALAMCGPLYYAEFIYLTNYNISSLALFLVSLFCIIINAIQITGFVYFESISSNVIYRVKNGVVSEHETKV